MPDGDDHGLPCLHHAYRLRCHRTTPFLDVEAAEDGGLLFERLPLACLACLLLAPLPLGLLLGVAALERQLGPREDRDPQARLFAGSGADALRTSIAKACRAAGVPLFSPHDLRHRRISLLHLRGVPWARIGEFVGQRNLSVTADVYSHVLGDETELDYERMLSL